MITPDLNKIGKTYNRNVEPKSITKKRLLQETNNLLELDEIITLTIKNVNDGNEIAEEYEVELLNWKEESLDLKINFKDSGNISRNSRNQQYGELMIVNKFFFVSKNGDMADENEKKVKKKVIPKQLPPGVKLAQIQ